MGKRSREIHERRLAAAASVAPPAPDLASRISRGDASALAETAARARALRTSGRLDEAFQVAAIGQRKTAELAAEESLAAFALGRFREAREASEVYPQTAAAMRPLLAVGFGEQIGRAPKKADPVLRALFEAARAAESMRAGATPKPAARTSRALAPLGSAASTFVQILGAAAAGARRRGGSQPPENLAGPLGDAVLGALAFRIAATKPSAMIHRPRWLPESQHAKVLPFAVSGFAGDPVRLAERVARIGPKAFGPGNEGTARLYEAFGLLSSGAQAVASFERALAEGADIEEALRGRWLAVATEALRPGVTPARAAEEGVRLAARLETQPHGGPFAAALAMSSAFMFLDAGRGKDGEAAANTARRIAEREGFARGEIARDLELWEATTLAATSPGRARAIVDRLLAAEPRNRRAWQLRAALAEGAKDAHEVKRAAFESAGIAVTAPSSALATPGAVACAVRGRIAGGGWVETSELPPDLAAARDALAPVEQAAVDAAVIVLLDPAHAAVYARARAAVSEASYRALLYTAADADRPAVALAAFTAFAAKHGPARAFDLGFAVVRSVHRSLPGELLRLAASALTARVVHQAKQQLGRPCAPPPDLEDGIHDLLHPEMCIHEPFDEENGSGGAPGSPEMPEWLGGFEQEMARIAGQIAAASGRPQQEIKEQMVEIILGGPTPESLGKLEKLLGQPGLQRMLLGAFGAPRKGRR